MSRMNITISETLAEELKKVPNKSRYIAEAVQERLARERSKHLQQVLAQAYSESAQEDVEVNKEWSATEQDGER